MGREIRRVIPNWQHPTYTTTDAAWDRHATVGRYRPLFDRSFHEAITEWYEGYILWREGKHPDQQTDDEEYRAEMLAKSYSDWDGGPPDPKYYRPEWSDEEATWWQVYETVTEGTPITPPFATAAELVEYLSTQKDFLGQGPRSRAAAEAFVNSGWAPSMILTIPNDGSPSTIKSGIGIYEK
jgi:hypothetical protein